MFTRRFIGRQYTADHTARPGPTTPTRTPGPLVRSAGPALMLPPLAVAVDPSDPATWPPSLPPLQFT